MYVKLIGITMPILNGIDNSATGGPERMIEIASRVCYNSQNNMGDDFSSEETERYVKARVKEGHESVIEHAFFTFEISGISRACSHQLVRHRIASYSQRSQRYVDESGVKFVTPESISRNKEALHLYSEHMWDVSDTYDALRNLGIPKEDARFVLPNATETTIIMTMNARSLRHFIDTRTVKAAQWEIKELALEVLSEAHKAAPSIFSDQYSRLIANGSQ